MPETLNTCKSVKFSLQNLNRPKRVSVLKVLKISGRKWPLYGPEVCRQASSVFDQHAGAVQRLRGLLTIAPQHTRAVYVSAAGVFALDMMFAST